MFNFASRLQTDTFLFFFKIWNISNDPNSILQNPQTISLVSSVRMGILIESLQKTKQKMSALACQMRLSFSVLKLLRAFKWDNSNDGNIHLNNSKKDTLEELTCCIEVRGVGQNLDKIEKKVLPW